MSESPVNVFSLTKHRLEALTDGIFAVAMTLLVIELKLPETPHIQAVEQLHVALAHLIPKFVAWLISFFVLAIFWVSHHRLFHFLRHVDGKLIWLTLCYLGFASLMPFSSALTGEYGGALISQIIYSLNMIGLGMMALAKSRHVYRHPELCGTPMSAGAYKGARLRTTGLIAVAIVSVLITWALPGFGSIGNMAFMLMVVFTNMGRRVEAREAAKQKAIIQSV